MFGQESVRKVLFVAITAIIPLFVVSVPGLIDNIPNAISFKGNHNTIQNWNSMNTQLQLTNGNIEINPRLLLHKTKISSHEYFRKCVKSCDCKSKWDDLGLILILCSLALIIAHLAWCAISSQRRFYELSNTEDITAFIAQLILSSTFAFAFVYFIRSGQEYNDADIIHHITQSTPLDPANVVYDSSGNIKQNILQITSYNIDDEFLSIPMVVKIPTSQLSSFCRANVCRCGITPIVFIPICTMVVVFSIFAFGQILYVHYQKEYPRSDDERNVKE